MGASVGRQTITAFILKAVITAYLQTLPNPLYTIPSTNAYCNTLIDPTMVTCFNCGKDSYFTTSCPELKDIGNIKKIKEEETFNKLGKEEP